MTMYGDADYYPGADETDDYELFETSEDDIRHPEIVVRLTETDGNAFAVLGAVRNTMRRAGVPAKELDEFFEEATTGDYDHLLQTCMKWVTIR